MKYVAYSYLFLFPIADYNRFSALFDHHPLSLLPAQILKNLLRDVDVIAPPPVFNYFSYVFVHNLFERSINVHLTYYAYLQYIPRKMRAQINPTRNFLGPGPASLHLFYKLLRSKRAWGTTYIKIYCECPEARWYAREQSE